LLQPITVYGVGCEGYFVKTGHRRYLAYQKLNAEEPERFNTILCMVSDAHNIEVIQIIENLQRRDLSAIELYHALSSLRDQGLTLKQIADVTGKSEKSIKNLFVGINETETNTSLKEFLDSPAGGTIDDEAARLDLLNQRASGQISRAELRRKTNELKQWTCSLIRLVIEQVLQNAGISSRNPHILPFFSGSCSKTEVSEQL
jgi:ParB family chromosome partitioning protein